MADHTRIMYSQGYDDAVAERASNTVSCRDGAEVLAYSHGYEQGRYWKAQAETANEGDPSASYLTQVTARQMKWRCL